MLDHAYALCIIFFYVIGLGLTHILMKKSATILSKFPLSLNSVFSFDALAFVISSWNSVNCTYIDTLHAHITWLLYTFYTVCGL